MYNPDFITFLLHMNANTCVIINACLVYCFLHLSTMLSVFSCIHTLMCPLQEPPLPHAFRIPIISSPTPLDVHFKEPPLASEFPKVTHGIGMDVFYNHPLKKLQLTNLTSTVTLKEHQSQVYLTIVPHIDRQKLLIIIKSQHLPDILLS